MNPFRYERASDVASACASAARPAAKFIAGGTNLVDLMKLQIEAPAQLVDITRLPLDRIEETADGGLRIGALVSNSAAAAERAPPVSVTGTGDPGRRIDPASQQSHDRRQPAATHALSLFL